MEFSDGSYDELTANQIGEDMFSQIDDELHHFQILSKITNHKSDGNKIAISDGFIQSNNGNNLPMYTTAVWKLQVGWKGGSTPGVPMKGIKASNMI